MDPITVDAPNDVTNTQITVNWTQLQGVYTGGTAVDVDSYELEWDTGVTNSWTSLATPTASETQFMKAGLTGGIVYGFRIRAVNEYGSAAVHSE